MINIRKNSISNNFPNDGYKEKDDNIIAGVVIISLVCLLGIELYFLYEENQEDEEDTS